MTRTPLLRQVPALHYQRRQAVARWLRGLGVGTLQVDVARWSPGQRGLRL